MSKARQARRRVREMMSELYQIRYSGADAVRISEAKGLADGYMRALTDLGVLQEWELLELVDDERRKVGERIVSRALPALRHSEAAPNPI